jgi:transposase
MERVVSRRQFRSGEKGGAEVGKTKRGKGTKWMVVVDGRGIPLGDHLCSASPSEVRLAETTLAAIRVGRRHRAGRPRQKPLRVIAEKGYDSDALRASLRRRGILLIAPHRSNRYRTPPQDGRVLRRYKRRWTVDRTFAWLGNFRRLVVRYDRSLSIYRAFFHTACLMIVLQRVVQWVLVSFAVRLSSLAPPNVRGYGGLGVFDGAIFAWRRNWRRGWDELIPSPSASLGLNSAEENARTEALRAWAGRVHGRAKPALVGAWRRGWARHR